MPAGGGIPRIWYKPQMPPDAASPLLPIFTLAAGVFLMIAPRIVSSDWTASITSSNSAGDAGRMPLHSHDGYSRVEVSFPHSHRNTRRVWPSFGLVMPTISSALARQWLHATLSRGSMAFATWTLIWGTLVSSPRT